MEKWKESFRKSLVKPEDLAKHFDIDPESVRETAANYPIRITPYFLNLIQDRNDPIAKQVIPNPIEMQETSTPCMDDPLSEETDSPVPNLVHRYPDRVLLMVTTQCPIYCRFCTRKRLIGQPGYVTKQTIQQGIEYIAQHPEVRDVILSGGDPLLLSDDYLEWVLKSLRAIPHLELIRIGSRVPGSLPQRITKKLCRMLKRYHPLYMNLHFNHPDEITPESKKACERLADAGIPLGSQTVLLKGVNDDPETMKKLMQKLLAIRVKPYYLYQADITKATDHFRTSVETGLDIMRHLRGFTSGMAVPHYVIDAPGGGGKIAVLPPDYVLAFNEKEVILKNYEGQVYRYPQASRVPEDSHQENGHKMAENVIYATKFQDPH
jgi:lysine 2,3-aminomutase